MLALLPLWLDLWCLDAAVKYRWNSMCQKLPCQLTSDAEQLENWPAFTYGCIWLVGWGRGRRPWRCIGTQQDRSVYTNLLPVVCRASKNYARMRTQRSRIWTIYLLSAFSHNSLKLDMSPRQKPALMLLRMKACIRPLTFALAKSTKLVKCSSAWR